MYWFYGAYTCYGLVRQVSGFISVGVSVYGSYRILDCWILRAEETLVQRHVKPPRRGKVSRKPRALSWDRTQVIDSPSHDFSDAAFLCP